MSGKKILLDSNIIIYLSKGAIDARLLFEICDELCVSLISYMEVMGYSNIKPLETERLGRLFSIVSVLPIDYETAKIVIELRKKKRIKIPDAIICATAIRESCMLVTKNAKDFSELIPNNLLFDPPLLL